MPRNWTFALHDTGVVAQLSRDMNCSPLLAQVLAARGFLTQADASLFLTTRLMDLHDPNLLPGLSEAADRIVSALQAGRRITIYGDYDVDGVTATSILYRCLKLAGAKVDYYIPCRFEEGYGLNSQAVRKLSTEDPQRLVVTVDCGICSLIEAGVAKELNLELIVTDHHHMGEELPCAATVVHPRRPGSEYPFPELCGAGVAFKLAWGICQRLGTDGKAPPRLREFLMQAVGMAAMGTVADVVPLRGENRVLVAYGLQAMLERPTVGLEMLLKICELHEKKSLTAEDIGFAIGPRINAAGRLGQARLAVELLTTEDRERAAQLTAYIDQLNKDRQTVERRMFKQAKELVETNEAWLSHPALVLPSVDWHAGVMGIVANRIAEHFTRPTIMLKVNEAAGTAHGSGRSFGGFDLHSALGACADLLEGFGGHSFAAGVRLSMLNVDAFREKLASVALDYFVEGVEEPAIEVDAEVSLADLTPRAVRELDRLGPYGAEHRRPVFAASRLELVEEPKKFGGGDRHLSLRVKQNNKVLRAVAFGRAEWADEIAAAGDGLLSLCFQPQMNEFRGFETVELHLVDWKGAATTAMAPAASA
ncbi:MAG TPA: single-stranded-DNA-specific exonuclease RecJ [Caulifigura sp.]|nr:single-stranded-DNA-specific exonuclease RecJ [Caulifigura sp.]